jgi:hypothetical protein
MLAAFVFVAFVATLLAAPDPAIAAPVFCPNDTTDSKVFIVDTTPDATCNMTGMGNQNGSASDGFLVANPTWEFIDSTGGGAGGTMDGSLAMGPGASGDFSIDPLVWQTYGSVALLVKDGQNAPGPEWAVFLLPFETTDGGWAIREYDDEGAYKAKNLSHAIIYGLECAQLPCGEEDVNVDVEPPVPAVPEPSTLALLAAGLGGAAFARRRHTRA